MVRFAQTILCIVLACDSASAQISRLHVRGPDFVGRATAVCIGRTDSGNAVYLTARHNFEGATSGAVAVNGEWHRITTVNESQMDDVASFEVAVSPERWKPLAESEQVGGECWVAGYGPEYTGSGLAESFHGVLLDGEIRGDNGLHPVVGDSGGPVLQSGRVVGIVSGYVRTMARSDYAERGYPTVYCNLRAVRRCLQQCYQYRGCPPGGCPIYLRPQIQQPMIGIGIPVGPPKVVGVATPLPPQPLRPVPDPAFITGPAGPAGPRGPAGPPGERGEPGRSVTREEISVIVSAWLDANRDALRGPAGPQGPSGASATQNQIDQAVANYVNANAERFRGPTGERGPQGLQGPVGPVGPRGPTSKIEIAPGDNSSDLTPGRSDGEIFFDVRPRGN